MVWRTCHRTALPVSQDIVEIPETIGESLVRRAPVVPLWGGVSISEINKTTVTYLIVDMRRLARGVERRWTQRTLKTNGRVADGTLTSSDRTRAGNGGSGLRTTASRRLLLRLHLRGNQLRIRQRVSVFPQGTLFSIFSCYMYKYTLRHITSINHTKLSPPPHTD